MDASKEILRQVFGDSSDREDLDANKEILRQVFGDSSDSEDLDANKAILRQVFGDSSDGEDLELGDGSDPNHSWEPFEEIKGLWLCRDFLSPPQQSSLLSTIENEGWFTEASHNQAMRFGDLPAWAAELSHSIRNVVHLFDPIVLGSIDDGRENACPFPSDLLCREPLFDQLILNSYQPGDLRTH